MKIEQSGWYRTRDGRLAEVVVSNLKIEFPVMGYITSGTKAAWNLNGQFSIDPITSGYDLIEYLGKERPKERKTVKMAPAVTSHDRSGFYQTTSYLYSSQEEAKNDCGITFVRWLIDSHAVEVEVKE
jgi:hypothetical protein